ncbi:hypothetical protein O6H91_03G009900 [Diphasiastrum complanatum]|uniref:Uncharacterized protein n=2 Tax=Diphasiastrum complanatum TaxID=34168 RepID=A0ACC2E3C5_DIPCM|nr:hypothetical protein O6H91_03G009900 [Diphasiastrum complanatum]KAJ7560998.1 hypothetical protein O6H91_03G009900 [Diphasiastrum complanatum]
MASASNIRRRRNSETQQPGAEAEPTSALRQNVPVVLKRTSIQAALNWTALLLAFMNAFWLAYHYQAVRLPAPVSAVEAGRRGFSEQRAFRHVRALTNFGPHPVGSSSLDLAVEYVLTEVRKVAETSNPNVDVEVELFHAKPGVNAKVFKKRSLAYTNLKQVIVRIASKLSTHAEENSILVSSHIDSVITSEGAGDCSSCVGVMLELVRALSHLAQNFKHSVIFLFNTGEEEGLNGAHSFITQHPLNATIRAFIDLEAMGAGGRSQLFQAGPDRWLLNVFARVAKHPSGLLVAQDVFLSGFVKSTTDFQVYKIIAGLSGLDFAYLENGVVYHTKNDRLELVRPGSLQHSGDNLLALLQEVANSTELPNVKSRGHNDSAKMDSVFFDFMGRYMIVYNQHFAKKLNTSIILQSLVLLIGSILQARRPALLPLLLALFTLVLSWILSIVMAVLAGFILSILLNSQFPYVALPWLVIGLFGAPSLFGALLGHSLGHSILVKYLHHTQTSELKNVDSQTSTESVGNLVIWEVEKLLFKAGLLQWVFILALGTWFGVGASYIALFWLVVPAVTYGLKEIFLFPRQPPGELKTYILFFSLPLPILISAETFIFLPYFLSSSLARFDKHPGGTPLWVGNVAAAIAISVLVCLSLVYLFPYVHRSGGVKWILLGTALVTLVTFCIAYFEVLPAYTKDANRLMNVAHVIETNARSGESLIPKSYISISSFTPGKIVGEMESLKTEGFQCANSEGPDFVTFNIKYGCTKAVSMEETLWKSRPSFNVTQDSELNGHRITSILMKTALARRWFMSVNTNKIKALKLEIISGTAGSRQTLIPREDIVGNEGWHIIQFVTDKDGPAKFILDLFWYKNLTAGGLQKEGHHETSLLKLRTDVAVETAELSRVLQKLPDWCTLFASSISPYTLAYLANVWFAESSDSLIF